MANTFRCVCHAKMSLLVGSIDFIRCASCGASYKRAQGTKRGWRKIRESGQTPAQIRAREINFYLYRLNGMLNGLESLSRSQFISSRTSVFLDASSMKVQSAISNIRKEREL